MAATWTSTDLQSIETAMAQGLREVQYNDRTVKYMSLKEMQIQRQSIREALGLVKRGSRVLCAAKKGTE